MMDSRGSSGLVSGKVKIFLFSDYNRPALDNGKGVISLHMRESGQSLVSSGKIKNKWI